MSSIGRGVYTVITTESVTDETSECQSSKPCSTARIGADRNRSESRRTKAVEGDILPTQGSRARTAPWRPFWLRQPIVGLFVFFFLCCAVVLPITLYVSEKNHGLRDFQSEMTDNLRKLWKFGPTAVVTATAIFWSRVEFQALRYFPWTKVWESGKEQDAKIWELDYTAMISPMILFRSFHSRHYFVFFISLVAVIFKGQIVLSTGLFFIQSVLVEKPQNIQVHNSFAMGVDEPLGDAPITAAFYHAQTVRDFGSGYPFGVEKGIAYSTFGPANDPSGRGTIDSPITAVVDGLFFDMRCIKLESYRMNGAREFKGDLDPYRVRELLLDLEFESCQISVELKPNFFYPTSHRLPGFSWGSEDFSGKSKTCTSLPQQHDHFLYVGAFLTAPENKSEPAVVKSVGAVMCSPETWTSPVRVVDDGITANVTIVEGQQAVPVDAKIWQLLTNSFPTDMARHMKQFQPALGDALFRNGADQSSMSNVWRDERLYQTENIHGSVRYMTEALGALVSHYQLRQANESRVGGSAAVTTPRLMVNKSICITMAALFGICMLIVCWASITSQLKDAIWPRNPATLLGATIFFSKNSKSSTFAENESTHIPNWSSSTCSPFILRTWLRIVFTLYTFGLIISLVITLRISQQAQGLLSVNEGVLSLWWTIIPAFALLLVTIYAGSSDMAIRDLAILSKLSMKNCSAKEIDISLSDMLGLRALYYSFKYGIFNVTLTQVLAVLCGILTTLSSMLFYVRSVPEQTITSFSQQSWLGTLSENDTKAQDGKYPSLASAMVMQHSLNLTWPDSTFGDLLFPKLEISNPDHHWQEGDFVQLDMPAAKSASTCKRFREDELVTNITDLTDAFHKVWRFDVQRNVSCPNGTTTLKSIRNYYPGVMGNQTTYPFATSSLTVWESPNMNSQLCSPGVKPWERYGLIKSVGYLWGKMSLGEEAKFDHLAFWICDYSWSEIVAKVHMVWKDGTLVIDRSQPPIPDESTEKPLDLQFNQFNGLDEIEVLPPSSVLSNATNFIDYEFQPIIAPLGAMDIESLGDAAQDEAIMKEIIQMRGILEVQKANIRNRLSLGTPSITEPFMPGTLSPIPATITRFGRQRLFQDRGITIALIIIIGLAFLVNLIALISTALQGCTGQQGFLDLEFKELAPNNYNSLAALDNLIHVSDSLQSMAQAAEYLPLGDVYKIFSAKSFGFGWFQTKRGEKSLKIGLVEDEESVLLRAK